MTKKKEIYYDFIKCWAYTVQMVKVMRKDKLFLYELYMMAIINDLNTNRLRPITRKELDHAFPVFRSTFERTLESLIRAGYVINTGTKDITQKGRKKPFKLSCTSKGVIVLEKYNKLLKGLCGL